MNKVLTALHIKRVQSRSLLIGLVVLMVVTAFACSKKGNGDKSDPEDGQVAILGSTSVQSSAHVPVCDANGVGQMFYIEDTNEYLFCNGSYFQTIDMEDLANQGITSIEWLGVLPAAPLEVAENQAYLNAQDKIAYVYNGSEWIAIKTKYLGARVVRSIADLPACNNTTSGHLFYLMDSSEFQFCNGSSYQKIEMGGTQYKIGVQVSGLDGGTLKVKKNRGEEMTITADGMTNFSVAQYTGTEYELWIATQLAGKVCYFTQTSEGDAEILAWGSVFMSDTIYEIKCESSPVHVTNDTSGITVPASVKGKVTFTVDATGLSGSQAGAKIALNIYDRSGFGIRGKYDSVFTSGETISATAKSVGPNWVVGTTDVELYPGIYTCVISIDTNNNGTWETNDYGILTKVAVQGNTIITFNATDSNVKPLVSNSFNVSGFTTTQVPDGSRFYCTIKFPWGGVSVLTPYLVGYNWSSLAGFSGGAVSTSNVYPRMLPTVAETFDLYCFIDKSPFNSQLDTGEYYYYQPNFVPSNTTINLTNTDFSLY